MKKKILIAVHPFLTDTSCCEDCEFTINPWGGDPTADLIEEEMLSQAYDGLIVGTKKVKNSLTMGCPALKVISRVGAGVDNVDIEHFRKNGVTTTFTPYGPTDSTAEQAVTLMLAGLKRIPQYDAQMKAQVWNRKMGKRLKDCTVGIVGTGRIGKRVAQLLEPFGCRLLLLDEYEDKAFAQMHSCEYTDKEGILQNSDILTVHVAYSEKTKDWIAAKELAAVKKDIIIVNAARGGIVNEADMDAFLSANPDAVYCADVYESEPYQGKLHGLPNVVLTPHVSTFTYGARMQTEKQALANCIMVLRGEHCENTL